MNNFNQSKVLGVMPIDVSIIIKIKDKIISHLVLEYNN